MTCKGLLKTKKDELIRFGPDGVYAESINCWCTMNFV